jgi:hypothetical protein
MKFRLVLFVCIIGSLFLWAQPEIIIRRDDVPFVIGQWAYYDQNIDDFEWVPFDSMRLWWDLTNYPGGRTARVHLLNPNQGIPPAPDTFPNAKIVELDTLGTGDVVWSYLSDTTYYFYVQGIDLTQLGYRFIGNYQPDYKCYAYPIYDGAGWNTAWTWTYEILPGMPYTANEQHQKSVVAKGKVRVPFSGEHFWPCLVIRDYMEYSDTWGTWDRRWIYEWVVPGRFGGGNGVAAAQSTNGASQNFMIVDNFFKLSELYVPDWDLCCPDFANTTIWPDTSFAGPFLVSTTITDSTGIGADSLFYNIDGGQFTGVGHDSVNGSVYYFTIPQVVQSCTLGYFLWAEDSFSVANSVDIWNTDPICAPESTYYRFVAATGIEEDRAGNHPIIDNFECFPNPFRQKTEIRLQKTDDRLEMTADRLQLKIFDATGRLVKSFSVPSSNFSLITSITWDGTDQRGVRLPSGVYFIEVNTGDTKNVQSVTLIR